MQQSQQPPVSPQQLVAPQVPLIPQQLVLPVPKVVTWSYFKPESSIYMKIQRAFSWALRLGGCLPFHYRSKTNEIFSNPSM